MKTNSSPLSLTKTNGDPVTHRNIILLECSINLMKSTWKHNMN